MKLLLAHLCLLIPLSAPAALVSFRFETVLDTSHIDEPAKVPFSIVYTFDTALPDTATSDPRRGRFQPVEMMITLGGETATTSQGFINVDDGDQSDIYALGATTISGSLLGRGVKNLDVRLMDSSGAMFNSTALPLSADFIAEGHYQQIRILFADNRLLSLIDTAGKPPEQRTPFTLQVVPEPASFILAALACVLPGLRRVAKARRQTAAG